MDEKKDFLQVFEEKLNFQSLSTETKKVNVDFFLSHILPQVQVVDIKSPYSSETWKDQRGDLGSLLQIHTIPKTFDKTWLPFWMPVEDGNLVTGTPYTVIFSGLRFPLEQYCEPPVENQRGTLDYECYYSNTDWRNVSVIPENKVTLAIQEAQKGVEQRLQCQEMSAEEIGRCMSREFSDGWLRVLNMLIGNNVESAKRWAVGADDTLSYALYPDKEGSKFSPYWAFDEGKIYSKFEFDYHYKSFLENYKKKGSDFKNGGMNALTLFRSQFKQVFQDKLFFRGPPQKDNPR